MTHPAFNRQIVKFSALAKLTQAKYGTISQPAIIDRFQNAISAWCPLPPCCD